MKLKDLSRCIALSLLSAILLVNAAGAATSRSSTIPVGNASSKSPAVSVKEVGREVAPGVFQINPSSIRNRRLILPTAEPAGRFILCIGRWSSGSCNGVYINIGRGESE
jgi:hypothetical protein